VRAYYAEPFRRGHLWGAASFWMGTPFVAHACIRGAGVDCVHLCAQLYIETGALRIFDPPAYTLDGGRHLKHSLVVDWVERCGRFAEVTGQPSIVGDLLCFKVGGVEHHVGVKITETTFVHAIKGHGVIESNLGDSTWLKRLTCLYRPMEEAAEP
jgi:cell wall-associated NlpC family hydrolase